MPDPSPDGGWTTLLSAGIGLAAVAISAGVSWWIAHRQIGATTLSPKRQIWIDELRAEVAEALALMQRIRDLKRPASHLDDGEREELFERLQDARQRSAELMIRIRLRLDPEADAFEELVDNLKTLHASDLGGDLAADADFAAVQEQVLLDVHRIIREEWVHVRKGR